MSVGIQLGWLMSGSKDGGKDGIKPAKASRRRKGETRTDVVTRFSKLNHDRLRLLKTRPDGKVISMNDLLSELLDTAETLRDADVVYLYHGAVFADIATARGEAIMDAARFKEMPEWPSIALVIGKDDGV